MNLLFITLRFFTSVLPPSSRQSQGHLVHYGSVVGGRFVIHAPAAVEKLQLTARNERLKQAGYNVPSYCIILARQEICNEADLISAERLPPSTFVIS